MYVCLSWSLEFYNMLQSCCCVFRSGADLIQVLIVFLLFLFLFGDLFKISLRLRRFKSDLDEIRHECSSCKCALTDGVGFSIWRHTFKMAAMTLFHAKSAATWWINTKCLLAPMQQRPSVPDNNSQLWVTVSWLSSSLSSVGASSSSSYALHVHVSRELR